MSSLSHSVCPKFKDVVQLLLEHGGDVCLRNSAGKTAPEEVHRRSEVSRNQQHTCEGGGRGGMWTGSVAQLSCCRCHLLKGQPCSKPIAT